MRWYVFDRFDCLTSCETAAAAAVEADYFSRTGDFTGMHIVQMSQAQFNHYVTHNDLAQALAVK